MMARDDRKISAAPLFRRLGEKKGAAKAFAKKLHVSEQVIANWRRRGVLPAHELARVANALGITAEQYLADAGQPVTTLRQDSGQYTLEGQKLLDDYNALPAWLQEHIARKASDLRAYADALPSMVREGMKSPPADPERYRDWEKQIEDDMVHRKP